MMTLTEFRINDSGILVPVDAKLSSVEFGFRAPQAEKPKRITKDEVEVEKFPVTK